MDVFSTTRLNATRLAPQDLPDLVALHLDEAVSRFLGGVRSADATAAYLETNLRHWDEHGVGLWTLRTPDGAFVGRAGLRRITLEGVEEIEIAYALARGAWGQGYATEIAHALTAIFVRNRTEPSLVGLVVKGNQPSENVLLKCEFVFERDAGFHGEACSVFRRVR